MDENFKFTPLPEKITISQNWVDQVEKRIKVIENYIKTSTRIEQLLSISGFSNKLETAKIKTLTDNVGKMIQKFDNKGTDDKGTDNKGTVDDY
mgnify:CR=1 FL=1